MENKFIKYILILTLIFGIILIYKINNKESINVSTNKINTISTIKTNTIKNDVYIESHKAHNYQIKGIVRNGTNKTVKGLQVSADIYDKNDNKLRTMTAFLESLSAGETWSFSIWSGETNYKYKNLKLTYNK